MMRLETLEATLDAPLAEPGAVLDVLLAALAKGQHREDLWRRLHDAAARDEKLAELAFAYEHLVSDKRLKVLSAANQAEVYLHAAEFFVEQFSDRDGAIHYAERAVSALPNHAGAFALLERLLLERGDAVRLAKLYVDATTVERDRERQLLLLRAAAERLEGVESADELALDVLQRIVRIEPGDAVALAALEARLSATGRHRDAARLLEQSLARATLESADTLTLRAKLIELYTGELGEPTRAIGHVESVLAGDPSHARALAVAEALLEHKLVAARAAAALSDAYSTLGWVEHAAPMLTRELKLATGARRHLVGKRLAVLKQDVLGDPAGALELLGPGVAADPADDELRRRYVELSVALGQPLEAAKRLARALQTLREPDAKARVGVELGNVYLLSGDVKRGLQALEGVVDAGGDDGAVLAAARKLAGLHASAGDQKKLASALELVVRLETETEARLEAARRLGRLCEAIGENAKAITAYRALVPSPWADEALGRLQVLYEEAGRHEDLADVLELRAERMASEDEGRELLFRAAELRSTKLRDRQRALVAWLTLVERHGPSREAHARLIPLLEQEKRWEELARVLDSERALAPREEHAALWGKLGHVRLSRLSDGIGALAAFRAALELDPKERTTRGALEKLLSSGSLRLEAVALLEPLARREKNAKDLVAVLEVRGELAPEPETRHAALTEAVALADAELRDAERALVLGGRALAIAAEYEPAHVRSWIARLRDLAASLGGPAALARVLAEALGSAPVDSPERLELAQAAAEAQVTSGELSAAIAIYRRALDHAPNSAELVHRMDELLTEQGSPAERVELYRSALTTAEDPARRRELLHALARVQLRELGDRAGALGTWRQALAEDPRDPAAHHAVLEIHTESGEYGAVLEELGRALELASPERRPGFLKRIAEIEAAHGDPDRALECQRELLRTTELEDGALAAIEELARSRGDARLVAEVLVKRSALALDSDDRAEFLERLGRVQALELDDADGAARSWMEAAALREGDDERAIRLYERVLHVAPAHREAAERLLDLYTRAGRWTSAPQAFEVLLETVPERRELAARLFTLEPRVNSPEGTSGFVVLLEALRRSSGLEPALAAELSLTQARVLASDPEQADAVAALYRRVLGVDEVSAPSAAEAFERFLAQAELTAERIEDRRWLFEWRVRRASDPTALLLSWARLEEISFSDRGRARELYRRALERDPARTDALSELARLDALEGDAEGALATLLRLRDHSQGDAVNAVDGQIARLLLDSLGRIGEALDVAERLLSAVPGDAEALAVVYRALGVPELRPRAAALLEHAAEAAVDERARAEQLEILLGISAEDSALESARRGWFERLLECRADDPEAALETALRGAKSHPDSDVLWSAAERFARRLDRPAPVADAYAEALERDLSPVLAEELGRRMVEFHEEWFEEPDRVVGLLKRVLALCPGAGWAFDRLKLAFNAAARWEELFELYDTALGRLPNERVELLREAAMAAKDFAGDAGRAMRYLEELASLTPDDAHVEAALERVYERESARRPLIALLERRLSRLEGEARDSTELRVADLYLEIDEPLAAFTILRERPRGKGAPSEPFQLLERLLVMPASREATLEGAGRDAAEAPQDSRPCSVREAAAELLREQYAAESRAEDVARMMEVGLEHAGTPEERISRLEAIVALRLEQLGDARGAFLNVAQLVELAPHDFRYRASFGKLAAEVQAESARVELLVRVGRSLPELPLRASLLREAADVCLSALGDTAHAIELHREILEAAVGDAQLSLAAARELDPLLEGAERHAEHCDVLEKRAELETDRDARREALGRAARVAADRLRDEPRAIRAWRLRLDDDARDLEALDGLIEVLERAGLARELVRALTSRATSVEDRERVRADRVRIARLEADALQDRPAAIEAWHVVREECGRDRESFDALLPLLEAEGRWSELAALLADEAGQEADAERRAGLNRRLGLVHRSKTQDHQRALRAFVAAGEWDEAVTTARSETASKETTLKVTQELLDLAIAQWGADGSAAGPAKATAWALDELVERWRVLGRHENVVTLLLRGAELPFERRRRREFLRDAACICSDHLEDSSRAVGLFRRLFAEDPSDPVAAASVTRLALLLEERGAHGEIAELWEQQARARLESGDRSAAAALWARAAEIWETRLDDVGRALADYREGAELGGEIALEALARLHGARGEFAQVAEALARLVTQSSREALAARALRLADAHVALGERRAARACLEQAAQSALDASAVRRRLAELYREDRDYARLAELLATEASRAPEARSRVALLREAALLHVEQRGQPQDAVPLLEQAVELDPDEPNLRLELSRALEKGQKFEAAALVLKKQIERYGTRRPKDRALVHFQLARVSLAAGRRAEAIAELGVATRIDPAHPGILHALARLAFEEGQLERAERMYRALLLVLRPSDAADAPSRASALFDLAQIAEQREEGVRSEEFIESAFEAALEGPFEAESLERALRERQRYGLLARALERRLERAASPVETARALGDLAELYAADRITAPPERRDFEARARACEEAMVKLRTGETRAWAALETVFAWTGDSAAEERILERRIDLAEANPLLVEDARPWYRLAEIRLARDASLEAGVGLLERALELDRAGSREPDAGRAEAMLLTTIQRTPLARSAVFLLERLAREFAHEPVLLEALETRLRQAEPEAGCVTESLELATRLGDEASRERVLRRAVEVPLPDAESASVRRDLAQLLTLRGELRAALELRESAAEFLPGDEARRLLLETAQSASRELGDADFAARIYRELLSKEPADRLAWEPLLELYRTAGDRERLVELLEQTAPLVESVQDRARLRFEQANLQLANDDPSGAATTLREILVDDPSQRSAVELLARIYESRGHGEELLELFQAQLDFAKDRSDVKYVVETSLRVGTLLESSRRSADALDVYRAALEWDGKHPQLLEYVARLAEESGDVIVLADALEALLGVTTGKSAVGIARRLFELREEQFEPAAAERALELGFTACPEDLELRETLLLRHRERGDYRSIARVLERAVEASPQDGALLRELIEAHRVAGDPERALEVLEGVIGVEAENAALLRERARLLQALERHEEAVLDLERAHAQSGADAEELVSALERAAERAEPARRRALELREVELLEALGRTEDARQRLGELVKRDPKDREALRRLAALEVRAQAWSAASTAYRRLIALEEGDQLVAVALELAQACENAERFADARGGLERALHVAPRHPELRSRLRRLYEETGAVRELAKLLEGDAAVQDEVGAALQCLLQAGGLLVGPEGDPDEAVRVLEQARTLSPESLDAVTLLARALQQQGHREEARQLLEETTSAHRGKRMKALGEVYRELARIALEEDRRGDALEALGKAFDLDLRNGVLAMELGVLALDNEDFEVAARAFRSVTMMKPYQPETGEGATPDAKADAHCHLAWMAFRSGDPRKARLLASKALQECPQHERARAILDELGSR
jgi:tetratricopeptide (TPR) repeat protein